MFCQAGPAVYLRDQGWPVCRHDSQEVVCQAYARNGEGGALKNESQAIEEVELLLRVVLLSLDAVLRLALPIGVWDTGVLSIFFYSLHLHWVEASSA